MLIATAIKGKWDEFSQAYPNSLNILQVDNGRFHKSKDLIVPENVILLFQPPYCPELNPIERLWEYLKADLKWSSFKSLEQLQEKVEQLLAELTLEVVASITGYSFILDALSVVNTILIGIKYSSLGLFKGYLADIK